MKMIRYGIIIMMMILGSFTGCVSQVPTKPFLFDFSTLEQNKKRLKQGDIQLKAALDIMIHKSDSLLKLPPHSVVEKQMVPPSGDKHDYMSLAGNWWPDPSKPNGLPYIRKDGTFNSEANRKVRDRVYLVRMVDIASVLGITYYFTEDEKYAAHLAKWLKVWFLDEKTRMNPNVLFAQAIPGVSDGSSTGPMETKGFVDVVDGAQFIVNSASWSEEDQQGLKAWFKEYLDWMLNSKRGKSAARLKNNIGTAFDMQVLCFALFTDNKPLAKQYLQEQVPTRMETQFTKEGKQPLELKRADAWGYSSANMRYWFNVARYAELLDVDLWNYITPSGKSIKNTFEWMLPYGKGQKNWSYGSKSIRPTLIYGLERKAAKKYGEPRAPLKQRSNRRMAAEEKPSLKNTPGIAVSVLTTSLEQ